MLKSLASPLAFLLVYNGMALGQRPFAQKKSDRELEGARQAFSTNCAGCRGLDGKGGERSPDIVTRANTRELSDAQLLQILQKGVPQTFMPAFGHLGDDVLRSLAAHLRSLQGHRAAVARPGTRGAGRNFFSARAGARAAT